MLIMRVGLQLMFTELGRAPYLWFAAFRSGSGQENITYGRQILTSIVDPRTESINNFHLQ